MGGACSTYGRGEKCIQNSDKKPEEKRPFVKCKHKWEDNIKMGLQEILYDGVD
jgi:hypothetical protein